MRRFALLTASVVVLLASVGCHKKPAADPQKAQAGVDALNAKLPVNLGVALMLTKASLSGDRVVFSYNSQFPGKSLPMREAAYQRGAMVQFACGDAAARQILDAGFDIDHRMNNLDGHEIFSTVGNLAVCSNYQ